MERLWQCLASWVLPPWAAGMSMPAGDKERVQRYVTQARHPSTTPPLATGGPVRRPHLYVVGERGPEGFVPRSGW